MRGGGGASGASNLHQLCTAPTPALRRTYTSSALHLHQLCIAPIPALHCNHTSSAPHLHQLCTAPTPALHCTYTSSTLYLHQLCTAPTPALHYTYTSSALHLHQLFTAPAPSLHCTQAPALPVHSTALARTALYRPGSSLTRMLCPSTQGVPHTPAAPHACILHALSHTLHASCPSGAPS